MIPIPQVDIAPLPGFQNIEPAIPLPEDEIHIEDLLGLDGNNSPQNADFYHNLHVGMVQIARPLQDPIFANLSPLPTAVKSYPEAFRYWVKFFSQQSTSSKPIFIPDKWMNFFSFLLLQTPTFDWASDFSQSDAWSFFGSSAEHNGTLFSIPQTCPNVTLPVCENFEKSSSMVLELLDDENSLMETPPRKRTKSKGKARISEEDLRRSSRLQKKNNGFKATVCMDKNCLGCLADPLLFQLRLSETLELPFVI